MSETDQEISNRLHQIFPNPAVASRIVDLVTSKRPKGWSHKSHAPYYKEMYALEIKEAIDNMIATRQDIIYRYSTWCTEETGISRQTVYHRVNQAIRYLIECMDSDHKYGQWYETVTISRTRSVGVVISFVAGMGDKGLKPEFVEPSEKKALWEKKMDEWLEGTDPKPFVQEKLALSPEEVMDVKARVCQLTTVGHSISQSFIRLIRIKQ